MSKNNSKTMTVTHAYHNEPIHILKNWKYNQSDDNFAALCGKDYDGESVAISEWKQPTCPDCIKAYVSIYMDN